MNYFKLAVITLLVLHIGLMTGCVGYYSKKSTLTEDDLAWIRGIHNGDTVYFDSPSGFTDTLIIETVWHTNRSNPFYIHFIDDCKGERYEAESGYYFIIKNSKSVIDGRMRFVKLIEKDSLEFEAYLDDLYSKRWEYNYDYINETKEYMEENPIKVVPYSYKDSIINDCLIFDKDNSRYSKYSNSKDSIESFVISKDQGLLSYKFKNGEEFCRRQ